MKAAVNLNDYVKVRLTDRGRAELRKQYQAMPLALREKFPYVAPAEDSDGWSKWQAWDIFSRLGPHLTMGAEPVFDVVVQFLSANILADGAS